MESLEDTFVSRANALQRKGRAGRVASGVCFHLFTSHHYNHQLIKQQLPEIQRVPLEQLCLRWAVVSMLPERFSVECPPSTSGSIWNVLIKEFSSFSSITKPRNLLWRFQVLLISLSQSLWIQRSNCAMSQISLYSCTVLNSYLALGKGSRPLRRCLHSCALDPHQMFISLC